jgi:hypothetical protein
MVYGPVFPDDPHTRVVEVPVSEVSEVAFDRAPLGARVYLGLRDGEVLHFGVGGDTDRLAAALRVVGVQVSGV